MASLSSAVMSSARAVDVDQHRQIVVVSQHLRQFASGGHSDGELVRPGAAEQAHLPPVPLHRLTHRMEAFVGRLAVGIFHGVAGSPVALFQPAFESGKATLAKSRVSEFLGFPKQHQPRLRGAVGVEGLRFLSHDTDKVRPQWGERRCRVRVLT